MGIQEDQMTPELWAIVAVMAAALVGLGYLIAWMRNDADCDRAYQAGETFGRKAAAYVAIAAEQAARPLPPALSSADLVDSLAAFYVEQGAPEMHLPWPPELDERMHRLPAGDPVSTLVQGFSFTAAELAHFERVRRGL
jgi:hypothetical protein